MQTVQTVDARAFFFIRRSSFRYVHTHATEAYGTVACDGAFLF